MDAYKRMMESNETVLREAVQAAANKFSAEARRLLEQFGDVRTRRDASTGEEAPKAKGTSRTAPTTFKH